MTQVGSPDPRVEKEKTDSQQRITQQTYLNVDTHTHTRNKTRNRIGDSVD